MNSGTLHMTKPPLEMSKAFRGWAAVMQVPPPPSLDENTVNSHVSY